MLRVLISLLALGLLWPGTTVAREFRAFAVAYKHELSRSESYASFRTAIRQQFESEIAPRLRGDVPNLVSYPENQTLMTYLVGIRGAAARQSLDEAGAIAALGSLAGPYAPQIAYYEQRFPGTSAPGQLLQLALTDTLARLVFETFAPLADEYDIYLSVSSNLAAFERITGPDATLLADPEADSSYAYRATAPEIYNRNFFFGPDGELLTIQDKAYLVPIEREQGAGLGLVGIETYELPVYELPFARVGTVISKDAWMPDVNDRLDQLGAELLIQPEAFSTWAVGGDDLWPPDKFQRGGWWMAQKHPAIRANVTPMLTGNLGDLSFDGQPLIAVEGGPDQRCLMGQRPEPGWAAVGIWSDYPAPLALCAPARRPELQEQGLAMQPGSGDARENLYADDVVFADLRLPARPVVQARRPQRGFASQALATGPAALTPQLASRGDDLWLSWIDSFAEPRQSVAVSHWQDGGWGDARDLGDTATAFDHFDNQWSPAPLALGDGELLLAYTAFPTENWDLFAARVGDDGIRTARLDDAESDAGVTRERGHSSPRLVAMPDGLLVAVWSDLRWPWIKPQVRFAFSLGEVLPFDGLGWTTSLRADGGPLTFEDEQLDARDPGETRGQAFPDVLVLEDGQLLFAWQEADATGQPGIVVNTLFGTPRRLADGYRPRLARSGQRQWLIHEAPTARGGTRLQIHERVGDGPWGPPRWLDPSAGGSQRQRHAVPLVVDDQLYVVFADNRGGDDDVLLQRLGADAPWRLDDAADGVDSHSPDAVITGDGRLMVAWQQETAAGPQIRWSRQELPRAQAGGALGWGLGGIFLAAAWRRKSRSCRVVGDDDTVIAAAPLLQAVEPSRAVATGAAPVGAMKSRSSRALAHDNSAIAAAPLLHEGTS